MRRNYLESLRLILYYVVIKTATQLLSMAGLFGALMLTG